MSSDHPHPARDHIIIPAWELVNRTRTIKKFNFFPSLISTMYLSVIVLYQVAFSYIYIFGLKDQFFSWVLQFIHESYFWQVALSVLVGLGLYLTVTPLAEGGLIALIDRKMNNEEDRSSYGYGISRGIINFLAIFELHNLLSLFKLLSIITFYLFLLRIFGRDYAVNISIGMSVYLGFAFIINMLTAYARFFVIVEGKHAFESISFSVKMALDNLDTTFHLYFTLLLVYVRTFITAILFIVFPFLVSAIFTYITIVVLKIVSIVVLGTLFLVALAFISHLNSVLEIFVEGIWYNAYKENKAHAIDSPSDSHGHDDHENDHHGHH